MVPWETVSFVFPWPSMFPREHWGSRGIRTDCFPWRQSLGAYCKSLRKVGPMVQGVPFKTLQGSTSVTGQIHSLKLILLYQVTLLIINIFVTEPILAWGRCKVNFRTHSDQLVSSLMVVLILLVWDTDFLLLFSLIIFLFSLLLMKLLIVFCSTHPFDSQWCPYYRGERLKNDKDIDSE